MSRETPSDATDPAELPDEQALETDDAQPTVRKDDEVAAEAPEADLEVAHGEDEGEELEDDEDELDAEEEPVAVGARSTKAQRDARRERELSKLRGKDKATSKMDKALKGKDDGKAVTPAGSKKHRSSEASAMEAAAKAAAKRPKVARDPDANPPWFKPLMFGFLIVGFLWILVYYLSNGRLPIQELAAWNILIGFGIAFIGFLMTTNWK